MRINTYNYQNCGIAVESSHPDDIVLLQIMGCYIGTEKLSKIVTELSSTIVPQTHGDIHSSHTVCLFWKHGIQLIVLIHAVLSVHGFLLGPSLSSEDAEQPLFATAEYLNNSGMIHGAWVPCSGTSEGDPELIGLLNQNLSHYTSQGMLLHMTTIKGPDFHHEDKLLLFPHHNTMDIQDLDRKKARVLLKRLHGKSVPSSEVPTLETIEEWDGVDPFGEWEGELDERPETAGSTDVDFSILDEFADAATPATPSVSGTQHDDEPAVSETQSDQLKTPETEPCGPALSGIGLPIQVNSRSVLTTPCPLRSTLSRGHPESQRRRGREVFFPNGLIARMHRRTRKFLVSSLLMRWPTSRKMDRRRHHKLRISRLQLISGGCVNSKKRINFVKQRPIVDFWVNHKLR